ncbi:redoxin domain-containing protein [Desulfobacula sp.]|uniref:peroxiredoxin family protein n=1 Tax=Desulfobacula sp. TaxID=2593537 RepID=UPI00262CBCB7|nr:redoxin domain-containing protein [Desulfobacula sp.]
MRILLNDFLLKKRLHPLVLICFLFFGNLCLPGQGGCTDKEKPLDFTLSAPKNADHKTYLGLTRDDRFSLGQIKAEIVIIEIFSMYCPVCQREAANVNTLFDLIQNNRSLREKVKLIGIGAGNSDFEVDFFKEKYTIKFPLFSDTDFSIHKKIGEVRTPHFFGLALKGDCEYTIFYSQSGEVSDPEKFLETLLKDSGLKNSHE